MRKILFHLNCFEQGGAERVVSNLANWLAKRDYKVIAATEWQGENEFKLDKRIERVHVGLKEQDMKKSRGMQIMLRFIYLRRLIRKQRPDIVISFTRRPNYRAIISSFGMGVPVIAAVRQDPKSYYNTMADKVLIPLLYRMVEGCVFQTKEQMEYFPASLQKRACVILNPVHQKYLNVKKPDEREKLVVQSGRLVDFKNQQMLLRAFLKVHEKHPDYILKIYGGDSLDGTKEKLEKIINENKAEKYIFLMGASDSLEKELPRASVYAFSSDYEGLPNALLEAMALGMPIVATDCPCGGPRTVMTNEVDGLLIPVGDQEAMTAGINRLIEDRDLAERLGERARKIGERINEDAIARQWEDYMEKIIGKAKR